MAEKVYHRSFGRGGGLGEKVKSEVNFSNLGEINESEDLAIVPYEINKIQNMLKRKKQEEKVTGRNMAVQQECNKKVKKEKNDCEFRDKQKHDLTKLVSGQTRKKLDKKYDEEFLTNDKKPIQSQVKEESSCEDTEDISTVDEDL